MHRLAKALVLFVITFHAAVFVVEAFLWMRPGIHEPILKRLATEGSVGVHEQALVLQAFLVNQGFYNSFLAIAGIAGLAFLRRGNAPVGYALIVYMCLSAVGAGLVLAISTHAYVGAFLQAVPAAVALVAMRTDTSR
jgi:putative membrane protein